MKEKHKRNRRFAGTLGTLGLPEDLLPGVPRITVVGRGQMLLENMGGVCAYCDYSSVCKFDENKREMREPHGGANEIWETMKTKGAALRGVKNDADMD